MLILNYRILNRFKYYPNGVLSILAANHVAGDTRKEKEPVSQAIVILKSCMNIKLAKKSHAKIKKNSGYQFRQT